MKIRGLGSFLTGVLILSQLQGQSFAQQVGDRYTLPSQDYSAYDLVKATADRDEALRIFTKDDAVTREAQRALEVAQENERRARAALDESTKNIAAYDQQLLDNKTAADNEAARQNRLYYTDLPFALKEKNDAEANLRKEESILKDLGDKMAREINDKTAAENGIRTRQKELKDLEPLTTPPINNFNNAKKAFDDNQAAIASLPAAIAANEAKIKATAAELAPIEAEITRLKGLKDAQVTQRDNFKTLLPTAQQKVEEITKKLAEEMAKEPKDQAKIDQLNTELKAAQAGLAQLNVSIAAAEREIKRLEDLSAKQDEAKKAKEKIIADAAQDNGQKSLELKQRKDNVATLDKAVKDATPAYLAAKKMIDDKNAEIAELQRKVAQSQAVITRFERELIPAQRNRTKEFLTFFQQKEARYNELSRQYSESRTNYDRLVNQDRPRLESARKSWIDRQTTDIGNVRISAEATKSATESLRLSTERSNKSKDAYNAAQARLDKVNSNRAIAKKNIEYVARQEGSQSGEKEALKFGSKQGYDEGKDYGYNGPGQGKEQGKRIAHQAGDKAGYEDGLSNGTDKDSYKQGQDSGKRQAEKRADEEGKLLQEPARLKKIQEIRNQSRDTQTIGNLGVISEKFVGTQEAGQSISKLAVSTNRDRNVEQGDRSEYKPNPGSMPHPDLVAYYNEAYLSSYLATKKSVYWEKYDIAWDNGQRDGLAKGIEDFKNDPTEFAAGKREGTARGSNEKGNTDGFNERYSDTYRKEINKKYTDKGEQLATDEYTNNAIVEFVEAQGSNGFIPGSDLKEADQDGIFRPGETIAVEIRAINYGAKAKTNFVGKLNLINGRGVVISQPTVSIPSLPGKSNVIIKGVVTAKIDDSASSQSRFELRMDVLDGAGSVYQNSFAQTIQYPTTMSITNADGSRFDGNLIPGVDTNIKVKLNNISKKTQDLKLVISENKGIVKINPDSFSAKLAAGAQEEYKLTLQGKVEAKFQATTMNFAVTQNSSDFVLPVKLDTTVIARHSKNPNAVGLLISGDLSLGGGKNMYESLGVVDTWDLRPIVDGVLTSSVNLNAYMGKVVHILAEDALNLDATSAATIKDYVAKGGTLMVWGSALGQDRSIISQLGGLIGVVSSGVSSSSEAAKGMNHFVGRTFSLKGPVASLTNFSARAQSIFVNSGGNVAAISFANEFTEKMNRIVTIGVNSENLSAQDIKSLVDRTKELSRPFQEKLNVATNNAANVSEVLLEIIEELRIDEARGDISYYLDNKKSSRLKRAIDALLALKTPPGNSFIAGYPQLIAYTKQISDAKLRNTIQLDVSQNPDFKVKVGWTKKSWAEFFCTGDNSRHEACR